MAHAKPDHAARCSWALRRFYHFGFWSSPAQTIALFAAVAVAELLLMLGAVLGAVRFHH